MEKRRSSLLLLTSPLTWPYTGIYDACVQLKEECPLHLKLWDVYSILLCFIAVAMQSYSIFTIFAEGRVADWAAIGYPLLWLLNVITYTYPIALLLLAFFSLPKNSVQRSVWKIAGWYPRVVYAAFSPQVPPEVRQSCIISVVLGSLWLVLNALLLFEKPGVSVFSLPFAVAAYLGYGYLVEKARKP